MTNIIPKYGLVAEYDMSGNVINSWHDPSGKVVPSASTATLRANELYLGSFHADFISVIDY